jgi:DNA-binding transcriptional MocR family regulator
VYATGDTYYNQRIVLDTFHMARARFKQLVDQLAANIREGSLTAGARLPTHREFAAQHGLALATATRVYAELAAIGLVSGETGRGTCVRETLVPRGLGVDQYAVADGVADLNFNYPALPGQADLLRDALRRLAASGDLDSLLHYLPHGGRRHERAIVARHLLGRGLKVGGENVLIVNGAQHGLAVTAMALLRPGDVVAADALTYPGFKVLAQTNHFELVSVPSTGSGPNLDALARVCSDRPVRAVYAMPTIHNPLGWVMGERVRRQLVSLARAKGLLIIEDGAYAFLAEDAPPPLSALAPERTVYVSGLSKSVATGLRVGFVSAPSQWIAPIERAIRATTWNTAAVMSAIACGWIDDGTVARLESEKRKDATRRQVAARDLLAGLPLVRHPSSYLIWLPLARDLRADQVVASLAREQISVSSAEPFAVTTSVPHAIRLALGSVDLPTLKRALRTVKQVIGLESARVGASASTP